VSEYIASLKDERLSRAGNSRGYKVASRPLVVGLNPSFQEPRGSSVNVRGDPRPRMLSLCCQYKSIRTVRLYKLSYRLLSGIEQEHTWLFLEDERFSRVGQRETRVVVRLQVGS
jgi:hypothetical protein